MGLLNKSAAKKPLRAMSRGGAGGGVSSLRPHQVAKLVPCIHTCPSGNDIRGWLTVIAQRDKSGLTLEQACDKAFAIEAETNPFPAVMGRVCPHPCEGKCNRGEKDGAVAINAVERFIGDWGLERGLKLPTLDAGGPFADKVAVIGAGPAGLSCAYQLARRGYEVTVFESLPAAGGMLRYGIPAYRLPRDIIDREVQRIVDLGVKLELNKAVGRDIAFDELRKQYKAVFLGIGAHTGKKLGIPGEDGSFVYTGTDFLRRANMGEPPPVGKKVAIIGGGDTAIDCARVCLRVSPDAEVSILYRRTRTEMPAIDREVEEAIEEKIKIEFLVAPAEVIRDAAGKVVKFKVQRMQLGEPDASGRRRPVPIAGATQDLDIDTVISAVSQQPDMQTLGGFESKGWVEADAWGRTHTEGVWSGGDDVNLGLATTAIGQGRKAAEAIHAHLRGTELREPQARTPLGPDRLKLDYYDGKPRNERAILDAGARLANPTQEVDKGITKEQALDEVSRCFSCGLCFGCERCWMYCTPSCFKKVESPGPGNYYTIKLDTCDGCKKCGDECPCGFLDMQ